MSEPRETIPNVETFRVSLEQSGESPALTLSPPRSVGAPLPIPDPTPAAPVPDAEAVLMKMRAILRHKHISPPMNPGVQEAMEQECVDAIESVRRLTADLAAARAAVTPDADSRGIAWWMRVAEAKQGERDAAVAELDRYKRMTYCAYCGFTVDMDADAAIVSDHICTCPKHPMRGVEVQRDKALAERDAARAECERLRAMRDRAETAEARLLQSFADGLKGEPRIAATYELGMVKHILGARVRELEGKQ